MRRIQASAIAGLVERLCVDANYHLGDDVVACLTAARLEERSDVGRDVLSSLLENAALAAEGVYPICQDTGMVTCFVTIGQGVEVIDGSLEESINEGVRRAYALGYLRKSVVSHPLDRRNTGDNTPAIIHYQVVLGDGFELTIMPKGGGSENMSSLRMLKPSDGVAGVKSFVLEVVDQAGPNPCPPIVVGIGLGGNLEKACLLAKKALARPLRAPNPDAATAALETALLDAVNALGIGPQGFGGSTTALAVHIETYPTHIASLPVAVNLGCHVVRHKTGTL